MPLEPSRMLSHYRLVEKIGEGGMGVVWRAEDTKLGRQVAIKVLPELFAGDPERLARFEREARVLASLNHGGIATIHGLEEAEEIRFLVLELVGGETLAERLERGPMPPDEAVVLGAQIATALEFAHDNGVVHRDLKPANIKILPDGKAKLLDFGLAKAFAPEPLSQDGSLSPTLTTPASIAGVILGTASYMSPEQAKGKAVDRRADVWAFGVVLFEMLSGKGLYRGETISETMAAVMMTEPGWDALPANVPRPVEALLRRCLDKDPARRLRDIGEARITLTDVGEGRAIDLPATTAATPAAPRRGGLLMLLVGMALAAAIAGTATWNLRPVPGPPLRKFELVIPELDRSLMRSPAISPDGRRIVYSERDRLWVRDMDQVEARELPGTEEGELPFWSPDSQQIGFVAGQRLWRVPATGGQPARIGALPRPPGPMGRGSWGDDGRIVFADGNSGLHHVSAQGGDVSVLLEPWQGVQDIHHPSVLPGDRGVLFVAHRLKTGPDTIVVLVGGEPKEVLQIEGEALLGPVYASSGHIVYHRRSGNPGIWAVPFSLETLECTGDPFLVTSRGLLPAVSDDGTLVHVHAVALERVSLVWVDDRGEITGKLSDPQPGLMDPAVSPDGGRVAATSRETESREVWIHDVQRGTRTRLTFADGDHYAPAWSPDGAALIYAGAGEAILRKAADGSGAPESLATGKQPRLTSDGRHLVYAQSDPDRRDDIWYLELEEGAKPVALIATEADEDFPDPSPDGRYLAYESDESGRNEIYLTRFPKAGGKWQVSVEGGERPRWSRDGTELFYRWERRMMVVRVSTADSTPVLDTPRLLFQFPRRVRSFPGYDVAPDDGFIMVAEEEFEDEGPPSILVVQSWHTEFEVRR